MGHQWRFPAPSATESAFLATIFSRWSRTAALGIKQPMSALMQNLSYAVSFASFLFALHLFTAKAANRAPTILLGLNFLIFGTQTALLGLILADGPKLAALIRPVTAMTIGPLAYLYFVSASDHAFRFRWRHAPHFVPALVLLGERLAGVYPIGIDLAIFSSFGAYTIALALRARKGAEQFAHLGDRKNDAYQWLIAATALLAAAFVSDLGVYLDLMQGIRLSQSTSLLAALVADLAIIAVAIVAALQGPRPSIGCTPSARRLRKRRASSALPRRPKRNARTASRVSTGSSPQSACSSKKARRSRPSPAGSASPRAGSRRRSIAPMARAIRGA
jgi:hypothetical protein